MLQRLVQSIQCQLHTCRGASRWLHSSGNSQESSGTSRDSSSFTQHEMQSGLPDIMPETDEGGGPSLSEEEMKQRKTKAVMSWLEDKMGRDKLDVAKLLQRHNVIVRGGAEEGRKLLDALVEWKQQGQAGAGQPT
ncbi:g11692 [Coccomyxa viridis]|uniref:G11692 protein n=1 Tax=Coccomyxa viridis TaxID=1274662 RepID=A0ABP1GFK5_9CHLO